MSCGPGARFRGAAAAARRHAAPDRAVSRGAVRAPQPPVVRGALRARRLHLPAQRLAPAMAGLGLAAHRRPGRCSSRRMSSTPRTSCRRPSSSSSASSKRCRPCRSALCHRVSRSPRWARLSAGSCRSTCRGRCSCRLRQLPCTCAASSTSSGWRQARRYPGALLLPTFFAHGFDGGSGGASTNMHFHIVMPDRLLVTLAQFFSFASLEINRFVATDNAKRLTLLVTHPWLIPLAAIVLVAGFAQPVWMLVSAFRRLRARLGAPGAWRAHWRASRARRVHRRARVCQLLVCDGRASGARVLRGRAGGVHFCRVVLAVIDSRRWRRVAAAVMAANIALHAGLASSRRPSTRSTRTARSSRRRFAIRSRRSWPPAAVRASTPARRAVTDPSRPHDFKRFADRRERRSHRTGGAAVWTVTVTNDNRAGRVPKLDLPRHLRGR